MRSRAIITVGIVLLVVLAGCGGAGNSAPADGGVGGGDGGGGGDGARSDAGAPQEDAASGGDGGDGGGEVVTRARIRTGEMTLTVEQFDAAQSELTTLARTNGGYVSDSAEEINRRDNRTWTTGHVVLRVPRESFSTVFERAQERGTVVSASRSTEDVSDRLTDIDARLTNLRAQRDRLRTLYENANETEDVLRIGEKLTRVQREIERLKATKESLRDRVAYATITVQLREEPPEPESEPESEEWYETGVLAAFSDSVSGVGTVLRAIVVAGAYLAPYVLVFGAPVLGLVALYRHGRRP